MKIPTGDANEIRRNLENIIEEPGAKPANVTTIEWSGKVVKNFTKTLSLRLQRIKHQFARLWGGDVISHQGMIKKFNKKIDEINGKLINKEHLDDVDVNKISDELNAINDVCQALEEKGKVSLNKLKTLKDSVHYAQQFIRQEQAKAFVAATPSTQSEGMTNEDGDLQQVLEKTQSELKEAQQTLGAALAVQSGETSRLQLEVEALKFQLTPKEAQIAVLQQRSDQLNEKLQQLQEEKVASGVVLTNKEQEYNGLSDEVERLRSQLREEKQDHDSAVDQLTAGYSRVSKEAAKLQLQQKILELTETLDNKEATIRKLKDDIAALGKVLEAQAIQIASLESLQNEILASQDMEQSLSQQEAQLTSQLQTLQALAKKPTSGAGAITNRKEVDALIKAARSVIKEAETTYPALRNAEFNEVKQAEKARVLELVKTLTGDVNRLYGQIFRRNNVLPFIKLPDLIKKISEINAFKPDQRHKEYDSDDKFVGDMNGHFIGMIKECISLVVEGYKEAKMTVPSIIEDNLSALQLNIEKLRDPKYARPKPLVNVDKKSLEEFTAKKSKEIIPIDKEILERKQDLQHQFARLMSLVKKTPKFDKVKIGGTLFSTGSSVLSQLQNLVEQDFTKLSSEKIAEQNHEILNLIRQASTKLGVALPPQIEAVFTKINKVFEDLQAQEKRKSQEQAQLLAKKDEFDTQFPKSQLSRRASMTLPKRDAVKKTEVPRSRELEDFGKDDATRFESSKRTYIEENKTYQRSLRDQVKAKQKELRSQSKQLGEKISAVIDEVEKTEGFKLNEEDKAQFNQLKLLGNYELKASIKPQAIEKITRHVLELVALVNRGFSEVKGKSFGEEDLGELQDSIKEQLKGITKSAKTLHLEFEKPVQEFIDQEVGVKARKEELGLHLYELITLAREEHAFNNSWNQGTSVECPQELQIILDSARQGYQDLPSVKIGNDVSKIIKSINKDNLLRQRPEVKDQIENLISKIEQDYKDLQAVQEEEYREKYQAVLKASYSSTSNHPLIGTLDKNSPEMKGLDFSGHHATQVVRALQDSLQKCFDAVLQDNPKLEVNKVKKEIQQLLELNLGPNKLVDVLTGILNQSKQILDNVLNNVESQNLVASGVNLLGAWPIPIETPILKNIETDKLLRETRKNIVLLGEKIEQLKDQKPIEKVDDRLTAKEYKPLKIKQMRRAMFGLLEYSGIKEQLLRGEELKGLTTAENTELKTLIAAYKNNQSLGSGLLQMKRIFTLIDKNLIKTDRARLHHNHDFEFRQQNLGLKDVYDNAVKHYNEGINLQAELKCQPIKKEIGTFLLKILLDMQKFPQSANSNSIIPLDQRLLSFQEQLVSQPDAFQAKDVPALVQEVEGLILQHYKEKKTEMSNEANEAFLKIKELQQKIPEIMQAIKPDSDRK